MSRRNRRQSDPGEDQAPAEAGTAALARAIAGLQVYRPARDFKAPVYRGEGDVELFLTQFAAVQHANVWTDAQAVLHIRAKLEGRAVGCGKGTTIVQIFNDLRARFGLNRRQAKDRLTSMRRVRSRVCTSMQKRSAGWWNWHSPPWAGLSKWRWRSTTSSVLSTTEHCNDICWQWLLLT